MHSIAKELMVNFSDTRKYKKSLILLLIWIPHIISILVEIIEPPEFLLLTFLGGCMEATYCIMEFRGNQHENGKKSLSKSIRV